MILGFNPFGYEGAVVTVEVDLRRGIPAVDIVGMADGSVRESRERIRAAIKNSGFDFPQERVLISLSPADLKKEGAGFDLAVALAIIQASKGNSCKQKVMVLGELELSGKIRPCKGLYAALESAKKQGVKYAITYETTEPKPSGILIQQCKNLKDAVRALRIIEHGDAEEAYQDTLEQVDETGDEVEFSEVDESDSLDLIEDKNGLKFAMMVAAAGGHHLLVSGSPGCGKTMALQMFGQLLPKLTKEEAEGVRRIYSIAGLPYNRMERPFRQPHMSASIEGMCGGGPSCRPGEISLAHNGVLFLDEAAEFRSSVLQMLRVPVETGKVTLSRAGRSTTYPAKFQLIMATNPCPCGNLGNKDKMCLCSAHSVELFWRKFSAPLLDRIAIRYDMNSPIEAEKLSLAEMREKIKTAVSRQRKRGVTNQDMEPERVAKILLKHKDLYDKIASERNLSPRGISALAKVALTVADLEGRDIEERDIETASRLRGVLPMDLGL